MNSLKTAVVLTTLVTRLRENESWCGETHVQKAAYILQELLEVPTGFEFILYKHGPFSFDLRAELTALRADGLLQLEPQAPPYGPRIAATKLSEKLQELFPKTFNRFNYRIDFVAESLKGKGVVELERLATALYVTREILSEGTPSDRAQKLVDLKPHVTLEEASAAIEQIDNLMENAQSKLN